MRFVLDYSLSVRWLRRNGSALDQTYAEQVLSGLIKNEAWVPSLWWIDMANVISRSEQHKLISQVESEQFMRLLEPLPISERFMPGPQLLRKALDLTRQYGLSTDRAVYLALAILENVPLGTLDDKVRQVAQQCGVQAYAP
jgi:predicted nucleic acid-binding protein